MPALRLLGLALGGTLALGARVAPAGIVDSSTFRVYQGHRALGTEVFSYERRGDSLTIVSHVVQALPGPDGEVAIDKIAVLVVNPLDYDLKFYQSTLKSGDMDVTRGLVMHDTAFTAYRESQKLQSGEGDRFARPPGRVFVIDAQVFVLFDVMCRNLHGKTFPRRVDPMTGTESLVRSLPIILLRDEQDQVTDIAATDLGTETIRWGARPVVARKLQFSDSYAVFQAWVGPQGYMLRLEQPATGLRVERDPPAVRPRARRAAGPPGG